MENNVPHVYKPNFNQLTYIGLRDIDVDEKVIIKEKKLILLVHLILILTLKLFLNY